MIAFLKKNKFQVLLWLGIGLYAFYFSWLTILRYHALYASYYDLGIMHQTVYNTFMSIKTMDWSRFLEQTNTLGPDQIKRMAIHNDPLLALLAPFYFIAASPATLLIIQALTLGLGAFAIFKISQVIFNKNKLKDALSLTFSFSYLLYPIMQKANLYEFHAVTLATTLLLFMFYFWLVKKEKWSLVFLILALLSKEQVGLVTAFFGIYTLFFSIRKTKWFSFLAIGLSLFWFSASLFWIIPYFRGGDQHFAAGYFNDLKSNPLSSILTVITSKNTYIYLFKLLGPTGFLSLLAPFQLLIALPEFAINLFSKQDNLRNIYYHYTAVLTPFIFISAIYGARNFIKRFPKKNKLLIPYILIFTFIFAETIGPLPFSKLKEIHPFKYPQKERFDVQRWAKQLNNDNVRVSSTGQLAPYFTNRRYFYDFSQYYANADYVVIRLNEIYNYPEKQRLIPVYEQLIRDPNFVQIEHKENFEVYKKIK